METYEARRELNEVSRLYAEHHRDEWTVEEVELLVEGWGETTLPEIAECLGRTIEACRQKYYELQRQEEWAARERRRKQRHNSQWDRGWTSLEDMGF